MSSALSESANTTATETKQQESSLTLDVIKANPAKITMTDYNSELNLSMYCYTKCSPDSEEFVKSCRGVVFQDDKLVMQAFPYTREFSEENVAEITTLIEPVFDKCRFFTAEEGSLVRVFAVKKPDGTLRWFTSTHRKFDAFRSKWASRESFGTAFVRALEEEVKHTPELAKVVSAGEGTCLEKFQNYLDPQCQYMFLVRNSKDNRIVCGAPSAPRVYHVGTFKNGELNFDPICVPMPKEHKFENISAMLDAVHSMDYTRHQGIIIFAPGNKQYKVFQSGYHYFFNIRGNEPSIKFRYLQVRNNAEQVKDLCYLYPDARDIFRKYEDHIHDIAKHIYNSYVQRFIKKQFVSVPVEEFAVMKEVHSWHEQDRINNRVSFHLVSEILNKQHPTSINRMIHRLVEERKEYEFAGLTPANVRLVQPGLLNTPASIPEPTTPVHRNTRTEYQGYRGRGDNFTRGRGTRGRGNFNRGEPRQPHVNTDTSTQV